jgi:hypothetical protein
MLSRQGFNYQQVLMDDLSTAYGAAQHAEALFTIGVVQLTICLKDALLAPVNLSVGFHPFVRAFLLSSVYEF